MSKLSWHPEPEQEGKISRFLSYFSRYEYALKELGYQVKNAKRQRMETAMDIVQVPSIFRDNHFKVFQQIHKWANFIKHLKHLF